MSEKTLAERLRDASKGYDEWRVQDPADGSYCISFNRNDSAYPDHEAAAWLESFRKRHPNHPHAKYVVAKARVLGYSDRLMIEAADAIEQLTQSTSR